MSGDGSAVAFRLNELQAKILKCDEEIKELDVEMERAQAGLAMQLSEKEAANKALIDKINANHADELSADIVLTEHYKDGAAEACIGALMKQQDSVILKDKENLKHVLLEYADSHLQSRENSLLAAHADEKQAKMSEEEEKYMHAVQMALISHKERMSQLN
jgi:hypothetical protein